MRRLLSAVLTWWLSPPTPPQSAAAPEQECKKAFVRSLKSYLMLAVIILILAWHALVFYCIWLFVAWIHGAYLYRYALADSFERPSTYREAVELLLVIDIITHVALAGFSSIGWWALAPVGLAWFFFGRALGGLTAAKEWKSVSSLVRSEYPAETADGREQITRGIIEERLELLAD